MFKGFIQDRRLLRFRSCNNIFTVVTGIIAVVKSCFRKPFDFETANS